MNYRKIVFFLCISFLCTTVYAYQEELEIILLTFPNVNATEHVLILDNSLDSALQFLDDMEIRIDQNKEPEDYKIIRKIHLAYLRTYAYVYHKSDMRKWDRYKKGMELVNTIVSQGKDIMETYPKYSDIRRVVAVSIMLSTKLGYKGFNFFVKNRKTAIAYAEKAFELNEENYMARVVINNFDSLAPAIVGAKKQRGYSIIVVAMQDDIPDPVQFEFYISQVYAFLYRRDYEHAKISLYNAKKLYPTSWRYGEFKRFIRQWGMED